MRASSHPMVRWISLLGLASLLALGAGTASARQRVTHSHTAEAGALAVITQCSQDGIVCTTTYLSAGRAAANDTMACLSTSTRQLVAGGLWQEINYEFGCLTGPLDATFDQRLTSVSLQPFQLQLSRETCDEVDCTVTPTRVISVAAEFSGYGETTRLSFHDRQQWGSCRYVSNGKDTERAASAVVTLDGVASSAERATIYQSDGSVVMHCAE
jgi:hypothetical protein